MASSEVLARLSKVLEDRKKENAGHSYVASLYARGTAVIARKLGEEALETVIAALQEEPEALVREMADLWFHSLVLLAHHGLTYEAVFDELQRREGLSGLVEKAARNTSEESQ